MKTLSMSRLFRNGSARLELMVTALTPKSCTHDHITAPLSWTRIDGEAETGYVIDSSIIWAHLHCGRVRKRGRRKLWLLPCLGARRLLNRSRENAAIEFQYRLSLATPSAASGSGVLIVVADRNGSQCFNYLWMRKQPMLISQVIQSLVQLTAESSDRADGYRSYRRGVVSSMRNAERQAAEPLVPAARSREMQQPTADRPSREKNQAAVVDAFGRLTKTLLQWPLFSVASGGYGLRVSD